jgi:NAD(P)-dependent dehydrogenase (short-subunit alcohol dehydrogenase family)
MKDFGGKIAVITGGGTGMGRELVRQLTAEGCHVAACDIIEENLAETLELSRAEAGAGVLVTGHRCDVADEKQVLAFRDAVAAEHQTSHINLLFNNAGIGGGGSFVRNPREEWERTFGICWYGVYYCTRAFMPMLLASTEGHVVNTSSVDGMRASLGGKIPHTAYSTAKFAVRGFTEGLIHDFKFNAPHLRASIVMPGGVGTDIAVNTGRILGHKRPKDMSDEEIAEARKGWEKVRYGTAKMDNDEMRRAAEDRIVNFAKNGLTPAQGVEIILQGVREERWRILVGKDAEALDRALRKHPLEAYDMDFNKRVMEEWEASTE